MEIWKGSKNTKKGGHLKTLENSDGLGRTKFFVFFLKNRILRFRCLFAFFLKLHSNCLSYVTKNTFEWSKSGQLTGSCCFEVACSRSQSSGCFFTFLAKCLIGCSTKLGSCSNLRHTNRLRTR